MTFLDLVLNIVVPILVAGVVAWVISRDDAPLSPGGKRLARWAIWAIAALWIVVWLLRLTGMAHVLHTPVVR